MADKSINELTPATRIYDNDLFVLSQSGVAKSLLGNVLVADLAEKLDGHGGIKTIAKVSTSGLEDTYRITYADNTTFPFTVTNGEKGDTAPWYVHIKYWNTRPESNDQMKDTPDNWMGIYSGPNASPPQTYGSYNWFQIKGATGNGISSITWNNDYTMTIAYTDGDNPMTTPVLLGPSMVSITPPQTIVAGQMNTYKVTLSDNTELSCQIYAGADGLGAGDMKASVYDPNDTIAGTTGGIPGYIEAYVPSHAVAVLEGSASQVSGLSLTFSTIADHVTNGRLPFIRVANEIYVYAINTSTMMYFVCNNQSTGTLDWIGLSNANAVTSGNVAFYTSETIPSATTSGKGIVQLQGSVDTSTTDKAVTPKAVGDAINSAKLKFYDTVVDNDAFLSDTSGTGGAPKYAGFPLRADIQLQGVTSSMIPEVVFGVADATSGIFAPIAETADPAGGSQYGHVYIYASEKPANDITIPTIICWK